MIRDFLERLAEKDRPVGKTGHTRVPQGEVAQTRLCHVVATKQALVIAPRYVEQTFLFKSIQFLLQVRKHKVSAECHLTRLAARP